MTNRFYVEPGGMPAETSRDKGRSVVTAFKTLEQARDAIRASRRSGNLKGRVEVRVRKGPYWLDRSLELSGEDSGTADAPVIWMADGTVRISGGRLLAGFRPVSDKAVLERLEPSARPHVVEVDLPSCGIHDFGRLRRRGFGSPGLAALELFFNGQPMTLARWPNNTWATIADVGQATTNEWNERVGRLDAGFTYEGDRPLKVFGGSVFREDPSVLNTEHRTLNTLRWNRLKRHRELFDSFTQTMLS